MTKIISKKQIKQKIDNSYQEVISCNEKIIQENNQNILQLTIKGTMKKEQNKNEYKPKNQFEALVINQFTNINNRLDNIENRLENVESRLDRVESRLENVENRLEHVETNINQIKNTPTMKKELN